MLSGYESMLKLTDRELCARVIEEVWSQLILGSDSEWLIDELVRRYEKKCGIERDDEGRIIPEAKP